MDKKVKIIGFLLLLISCTTDVKVKRDEENIDRKTIIFLDHTGDTIIKCQCNDTPIFEVERMVSKDSKTYYVKLDSIEYLELCVYNDLELSVIWQIRKRK